MDADARSTNIAQKIRRLREMEAFFRSLPDRRAESGLGPVPDDIRAIAYDESEAEE